MENCMHSSILLFVFIQMNTRERIGARRQATTRMDINEALRIVKGIIG